MRLTFTKHLKLPLLALIFLWVGTLHAETPPKENGSKTVLKKQASSFVHPGILHNANDLARIKSKANSGSQLWKKRFELFKQNTVTSYEGKIAYTDVYRGDGVTDVSAKAMSGAAGTAYRSALMWVITGDITYANIAKNILKSWSSTLQTFSGSGAKLIAAWYGFPMVNAAEILKHTDSGWSQEDIQQTENMFRNVIYPEIEDFQRGWAGNWDTAITRCIMGIGIFLDDEAIFNKGVDFLSSTTDEANGTLKNYIYDTGQCWESGRDQEHTQFGLIGLADACEIGLKQGLDLYGLYNNKLLKGFEYTAKYNLGYDDVPYTANYYGNVISDIERGNFLPGYEMVYNHYFNRKGVPLNEIYYTKKVVDQIRATQGAETGTTITTGFGTLLYNEPTEGADESSFIYIPAQGDYRTTKINSSLGTPSNFEVYTNGSWTTATAAIGLATPLLIRDGHSAQAAGSGNRNLKNLIVGEGYGAILKAEINVGTVSKLNIVAPGRLNSIPLLYFANGGQAVGSVSAVATISKVNVTGADIKNSGSGYTTANVSFSGGGGSGAAATAVIVDGSVVGITITNPGSDYTSIPTIAITGDGMGAEVTAKVGITEVTISNGGSGYTIAPTVIAGTYIKVSNGYSLTVAEGASFQKGSAVYTEGGTGILNIRRGNLAAENDVNFITATNTLNSSSLTVNFGSTSVATTNIISGGNFTFGTLGIEGRATFKISEGTVMNVAGNITVNSTSVIDATEGTIGFINTTPFTSVTRTIADNTFKNATVNKIIVNSTEGVTLNQELEIAELDMQEGLLNIPANSTLRVSKVSGGNNNAYINTQSETTGAIAKVIFNGLTTPMDIPLGNGGNYLPVSITPQSASDFELSVLTGLTENGMPNGNPVTDKSKYVDAVYHLMRSSGTGDFVVKLGFPESLKGSEFINPSGVYFGIAGNDGTNWIAATSSGNNTENYATATFNTNNAGIYRLEIDNALPLKFVKTEVKAIDNYNRAEVSWTTLNEVGVQGFEIQRSADGKNFQAIGTVRSDGSQFYQYVDENLLDGTSYYRIKSIEINNHDTEFSPIISLSVKFTQRDISVYPNPVKGGGVLNVQLTEEFLDGAQEADFSLVDITGRKISMSKVSNSGQHYALYLPDVLKSGVYQLFIRQSNVVVNKSVLVY